MKNLSCFLLLIGFFFNTYVLAQPELDTTFASTGKTILQFATVGMTQDMLVQPDNKIILVGSCFNINLGSYPICLIRLNENGSFDTTFGGVHGNTGYVFSIFPGIGGPTKGIALQNDGKIVVITTGTVNSAPGIAIIRYNSNGSLDSSFGTGGISNTPISGIAQANKVIIQPDGKIVVVGFTGTSNYQQFVARYLPNGTLDISFGSGGIAPINIPGNLTAGLSIALQDDGKILTGGAMATMPNDPNPSTAYLLTRLNRNGSPDTTFDGDGFKSVVAGINLVPQRGFSSIAVQTDGRIVALGDTNILYRFNSDGSLDTSFDTDGSRPALNGSSDAYDLVVTPSGKITVVGNPSITPNFPNIDYRVARYLPNGSPDPNFSGDGFLDINFDSGSVDRATAVALDTQGRIAIGGRTSYGGIVNAPWSQAQFSVTRLLAQPSQNVGFSGRVINSDGTPIQNAFITLKNGSEIIGNARTNPFGYFRFKNVQSNQTYTISTRAKGLNFTNRIVLVDDEITNYTIIGDDLPTLVIN